MSTYEEIATPELSLQIHNFELFIARRGSFRQT